MAPQGDPGGESEDLTVTYESKARRPFNKTVTVVSNDTGARDHRPPHLRQTS